MTATEAKFDGCKGVDFPALGYLLGDRSLRIAPLRSNTRYPSDSPQKNFREQLVWLYHENTEPKLYWCNEDDQWFELHFQPVDKP